MAVSVPPPVAAPVSPVEDDVPVPVSPVSGGRPVSEVSRSVSPSASASVSESVSASASGVVGEPSPRVVDGT